MQVLTHLHAVFGSEPGRQTLLDREMIWKIGKWVFTPSNKVVRVVMCGKTITDAKRQGEK